MIPLAIVVAVVAAPLLLGLIGAVQSVRAPASTAEPSAPWNWRLSLVSALLYTLAYNLTFFIQELFLVVPKAFTPGLDPTLFHNNHTWEGEHPLAELFQGTGALATLISGYVCALLLRYRAGGMSTSGRLLLIWMAYHGLFQALPQIVIGAMFPGNDVGMAMHYFDLGATAKTLWAMLALIAIPPIAIWLMHRLLGLAEDVAQLATPGARTRFVFLAGVLPAILAIGLIIAFRVPRELIEVLLPPVVVTWVGMAWMLTTAWRVTGVKFEGAEPVKSLLYPLVAVLALLLLFQLVLRPGIRF
jgi:hypothetical protein